MAEHFPWTCPSCGRPTTVTGPHYVFKVVDLVTEVTDPDNGVELTSVLIECPNQKCKAQAFRVSVKHGQWEWKSGVRSVQADPDRPVGVGTFHFLPSTPQPLSAHAPASAQADYQEAYLIRTLSPKASATLARRALQGMIRDYWKEVHPTLHQELMAIKDKCDSALYDAMMGIKSIGNIGAHPEQDVNLIVDIEQGEAQALLDLIHVLDQEWYVARAARDARIAKVKALSVDKKMEQGK